MLNLSVIRQLIPEEKQATLESALAFLQDVAQPSVSNNNISETMDAKHFNTVQKDIVYALNVLFTEIDNVEVILKQAANRTDSGLVEMATKLDSLYKKANDAKTSLDNRESPLVSIDLSRVALNNDIELYGTKDIASVSEFGLTTQVAGKILQSSYSGIPTATVNINTHTVNTYTEDGTPVEIDVPCRIGIPANIDPYAKKLSSILNENNTTFWSETILSETLLHADKDEVSWLTDTAYVSGAAVQLVFDFETAIRISQLEIVPFSPMPMTFLEIKAGDTTVWESTTGRIAENSGKYILFVEQEGNAPVVAKKFTVTVAQPHCRQIEYGLSQQTEQDLRYWQSTAEIMQPESTSIYNTETYHSTNNEYVQSSLYNNNSAYTISDTINNWNSWAENFPQMLASKGIVLPKEQYNIVKNIGNKFGQISELLSSIANPLTISTKKTLRYEYTYGFRQVNFVYEEFGQEGRFISDPINIDGELRQVKAAITVNPANSTITAIHDGELEHTGTFVNFSNKLQLGSNVAEDHLAGMYCYLEGRKHTIFKVISVDIETDILTLDKSQKSAFPNENSPALNGTWYFYTEETLADAEKNITARLSLRDTDLNNAVRIDNNAWTEIETQTEQPVTVLNPYRIAGTSTGDTFVIYIEDEVNKLAFCSASGIVTTIAQPASFTITDIFSNAQDSVFIIGYVSGSKIKVYELTSLYTETDVITSNIAAVWTEVSPTGYAEPIDEENLTEPAKLWYSDIKPGISVINTATEEIITIPYKSGSTGSSYGISSLRRPLDSNAGTAFVASAVYSQINSTQYFPFIITSATTVIQNDIEYVYLTKTTTSSSIDSQYINGVYRCTLSGGMEPGAIFYSANLDTYQAFDFVKVANAQTTDGTDRYSVFGVTSFGRVIEAKIQPIDEYTLLNTYSSTVSTWDTLNYASGLTTTSDNINEYLYVIDRTNHCIKVFTIEEENVINYYGWIGYGEDIYGESSVGLHMAIEPIIPKASSSAGGFRNPEYITIDPDKNILVSDTGNNRIQKLNQLGQPIYWLGEDSIGYTMVHNNEYQPFEIANSLNTPMSGESTGVDGTTSHTKVGWDINSMQAGRWYANVKNINGNPDNFILEHGTRVRKIDSNYSYAEIVCSNEYDETVNHLVRDLFVVQKLPKSIIVSDTTTLNFSIRVDTHDSYTDCIVHIGNSWDGTTADLGSSKQKSIKNQITINTLSNISIDFDTTELDSFLYIAIELQGLIQHNPTDNPDNNVKRLYISEQYQPLDISHTYVNAIGCVISKIIADGLTENLITREAIASDSTYGLSSPRGIAVTRISTAGTSPSIYHTDVISVADYANNRIQNIPIRTYEASKYGELTSAPYIGAYELNTSISIDSPTSISVSKYEAPNVPYLYSTLTDKHAVIKTLLAGGTVQQAKIVLGAGNYTATLTAGSDYSGTAGNALNVEILETTGNPAPVITFSEITDTLTIVLGVVTPQLNPNRAYYIVNQINADPLLANIISASYSGDPSWVVATLPSTSFSGGLATATETLGMDGNGVTKRAGLPTVGTTPWPYLQSTEDGGFSYPTSVAINNERLHIIDRTGRIQTYTIGNGPNDTLDSTVTFGSQGTASDQTLLPHSLYIDKNSNMYISDAGNNRIKLYSTVDSFAWNTTQVSVGDQVDVVGVEYIHDRYNRNLQFYVCQSDGHVYSYSLYNSEWRRTSCDLIAGGIASLCSVTLFSGDKVLYAISNAGNIYKSVTTGQWQWLRAAAPENVLTPVSISETFTSTDANGKIKLSEWPYIDFESMYSYYNNYHNILHYNPNNALIPVQNPFSIEIVLKDGTKAISDTTGVPFQTTGRKRFHTIPSSINTMTQSAILANVSAYIMSAVTIVDEEALGNYTDQLSDSGVNFKRGQTSLAFSRIVGKRIFKSQYKDWIPDPSFKIGLLTKDINGLEKLYHIGSSTHKVTNLPNPDVIPKEGMIIFREELPRLYELTEPGLDEPRHVEIDETELKLVVFDFFAPDYVVPNRNSDGTIERDENGEYVYTILQTRSVPYTSNHTDYLRGTSPDVSKKPYNANVPINDAAYNPVFMYVHNGKEIAFNSVMTEKDIQSITVNYHSLELRPRLILDINRKDLPATESPIISACNLLIGRIIP